jgi:hypothetical protein
VAWVIEALYALQRITGFRRISHYGLLANAARRDNLARARELLAVPLSPLIAVLVSTEAPGAEDRLSANAHCCPCGGAPMVIIERFARGRAPRATPPTMRQPA